MMAASGATLYTAWIDIGLKGLDKVQSYMQSAVNVVQASTTQISSMFSRSESAIHSFIGAANPMAMNTFGASVEILKARIGQNFTPYVLQAAKAVQDLSRWIKEMNPETKKAIANWVMYGVAAAGAFYALNQILAVSRAIVANPLALAILGIAAAAVKAGADMDKMIKSMDAAIERGERMKKGIFTEREYNGSTAEAIVNDSSMTKDEKIAKAKELKAKMIAESHQLAADNKNDTFGKQASTTFQWAKGQLGFEDSTANDAKKMEELNNEIGLLTNAIDKMAADKPIEFTAEANLPRRAGAGNNRLMLGAMGGMQGGGGTQSLDSSYSRLNAGALGMNDLQRELLKIQMESLVQTRDMSTDVSSMLDILGRAVGL